MCRINLMTLSLLLVLGPAGLMSEHTQNADGTIKDLYEYLLQREYAAPVSYADHQIKRKAVRSPSLRLRFGRRSDPSMPVRSEEDDMMVSRPIRAPQLRLRFGRQDPMFPTGEDVDENDLMSYYRPPSKRFRFGRSGGMEDDMMDSRPIRAPQLRLRFGRQDPMLPTGEDVDENDLMSYDRREPSKRFRWGRSRGMFPANDIMQQKSIRAPQLRLRFGRSDPTWAVFNEHQLDGDQIAKAAPGSSPASRNEHADDPAELTDETDTTSMNEK